MAALVAAPDTSTWFGRRDRTLLVVALQTGLRVSELINLSCGDIVLGTGAHVRCMGKGRKERATPLRKDSVDALRSWLTERPGNDGDPLFTSIRGGRLSRDAVERIRAEIRRPRNQGVPVTQGQARHTACSQTCRRHDVAPIGGRLRGDRTPGSATSRSKPRRSTSMPIFS